MAFVKKNADANEKGFTRVVIFRELKKGHMNSKARFHAVQVKYFNMTSGDLRNYCTKETSNDLINMKLF